MLLGKLDEHENGAEEQTELGVVGLSCLLQQIVVAQLLTGSLQSVGRLIEDDG